MADGGAPGNRRQQKGWSGGGQQSRSNQYHGRYDSSTRDSSGGERNRRHYSNGDDTEAPSDMESLKNAIAIAEAGTGAVSRALMTSTFRPRARAFTSLIQMCGKVRSKHGLRRDANVAGMSRILKPCA